MKAYKDFLGFDVVEPTEGIIHPAWTSDLETEDDKDKMVQTLKGSGAATIFRRQRKILESRYRTANIDFDKPHVSEQLLYNEGYKQAIRDLYKILPRPKGD